MAVHSKARQSCVHPAHFRAAGSSPVASSTTWANRLPGPASPRCERDTKKGDGSSFLSADQVVTDDLGQYRVHGLPPGRYAVGTVPEPGPSDGGYPFAPAYYPGTQNPAEAEVVTVRPSGRIKQVSISSRPAGRVVRVSGTVTDSRGRSLAGAVVSLVNVTIGSVLQNPVKADGTFTVSNVAPGEYGLAATLQDPVSGARDMVMIPIAITGADLANLVLPIVPGSRISGRVMTDIGNAPAWSPTGLQVSPFPLPSSLPAHADWANRDRPRQRRR